MRSGPFGVGLAFVVAMAGCTPAGVQPERVPTAGQAAARSEGTPEVSVLRPPARVRAIRLVVVPLSAPRAPAVRAARQVAAWWMRQAPGLRISVRVSKPLALPRAQACAAEPAWSAAARSARMKVGAYLVAYAPWCTSGPGVAATAEVGGRHLWVGTNDRVAFAHELGHNLGLGHADEQAGGQEQEYLDIADVMGGGTRVDRLADRRLSGYFRYRLGAPTVQVRAGAHADVELVDPGHPGAAVLRASGFYVDRVPGGGVSVHRATALGQALIGDIGTSGRLLLGDVWRPPGSSTTLVVGDSTPHGTTVHLTPGATARGRPRITRASTLSWAPVPGAVAYLVRSEGATYRLPAARRSLTLPDPDAAARVTAVTSSGHRSTAYVSARPRRPSCAGTRGRRGCT